MFITKILYFVVYFATGFFIPILSRFLAKFYPCSLHSYIGDILKYNFNNFGKKVNNKHPIYNVLKKQYFYSKLLYGTLYLILFTALTFLAQTHINSTYPLYLLFIFLFLLGFSANIDAKCKLIPDIITYPMIMISILIAIFNQENRINSPLTISSFNSIYSMLYTYILCSTFALMFYFKYPYSFGGGDVKLLTAISGFCGAENLPIILLLSFVFSLVFFATKKQKYFALAPIIFPSFIIWLFMKILLKNFFLF